MSKTILMIGDSWGVPNYQRSRNPNDNPYEHTEYILRNLGYNVYNCCLNGGFITLSIRLAKRFLSGEPCILEPKSRGLPNPNCVNFEKQKIQTIDKANPKIDWLICFHTECLRAHHHPHFSLQQNIEKGYHRDYLAIKNFADTLQCKVAIIGGQSPVIAYILKEYINPEFLIVDWRSEIVGKKLPEVHWLGNSFWIEHSNDPTSKKIEYIDMANTVLDSMLAHPDFIDNIHPAGYVHKSLVERLQIIL